MDPETRQTIDFLKSQAEEGGDTNLLDALSQIEASGLTAPAFDPTPGIMQASNQAVENRGLYQQSSMQQGGLGSGMNIDALADLGGSAFRSLPQSARRDVADSLMPERGDPGTAMGVVNTVLGLLPAAGRVSAQLGNKERAQEEGFGANLRGAAGVLQEFADDPASQTYQRYAEDINFPYPEALGLTLEVFEPGPGEFKAASAALGNAGQAVMALPFGFRNNQRLSEVLEETLPANKKSAINRTEAAEEAQTSAESEEFLNNVNDVIKKSDNGMVSVRGGDFSVDSGNYRLAGYVDEDPNGQPYMYINTLENIAQREAFQQAESYRQARLPVPESIQQQVSARPGRMPDEIKAVIDLADVHGIPIVTYPSAFGAATQSTPALRSMYNKMGFVPFDEAAGGAGQYIRQPMPTERQARLAETQRRQDVFEGITGVPTRDYARSSYDGFDPIMTARVEDVGIKRTSTPDRPDMNISVDRYRQRLERNLPGISEEELNALATMYAFDEAARVGNIPQDIIDDEFDMADFGFAMDAIEGVMGNIVNPSPQQTQRALSEIGGELGGMSINDALEGMLGFSGVRSSELPAIGEKFGVRVD